MNKQLHQAVGSLSKSQQLLAILTGDPDLPHDQKQLLKTQTRENARVIAGVIKKEEAPNG